VWVVVAFRMVNPNNKDEVYLAVSDGIPLRGNPPHEPRLIVEPRKPAPPIFTEVVIPERRVTMKDVYGCKAQDVLNKAEALGYEVIGFRKPEPGDMYLRWYNDRHGHIRPNGEIGSTNLDPQDPEITSLLPFRQELLQLGHCGGIRAIVRKKQVEADPFA